MGLFLGIILSLLPQRYRDRLPASAQADLKWGALASGVAVSVAALGVFILRYLSFIQYRVGDLGQRAIAKGQEGVLANEVVHYGMGAVATGEYLLQPLTLVLIYFAFEGAARFLAALVTEEITGTLPLYALAWVEGRMNRARAERALGPRVPDIVETVYSPDYDLRVFTCRRKHGWDKLMTVDWQGQLYAVIGDEAGKPPHHFIYRLQKSPPGRVVRHLHAYDPDEVVRQAERPPGFLAWVGDQARDRLLKLRAPQRPPAPDIVERTSAPEHFVRIASAQPKPEWNALVTIEYAQKLYEVAKQEAGTSAYPYVYLLRDLPRGTVVRKVLRYAPGEASAREE